MCINKNKEKQMRGIEEEKGEEGRGEGGKGEGER